MQSTAPHEMQLDAIDGDFQEAPEHFSTLPWVVRVMGTGAVDNGKVARSAGSARNKVDNASESYDDTPFNSGASAHDSTVTASPGETSFPEQSSRLRTAERLRQERRERRARRRAVRTGKYEQQTSSHAPEKSPQDTSGTAEGMRSTAQPPVPVRKSFHRRLTSNELQMKRINEGRAILMEQQNVASNAASFIVDNCSVELATALETFTLTLNQLVLVREHLQAIRATVAQARIATKSDRTLLQLFYDRSESVKANNIIDDLKSIKEESALFPATIDDGDFTGAARLLNSMKVKLKLHEHLQTSIIALAKQRENVMVWHGKLLNELKNSIVDAVYVGLVEPCPSHADTAHSHANHLRFRWVIDDPKHSDCIGTSRASRISANSELSLCGDLARFVHTASMIGPDAVACLCRELSASTGKHIGKIMDQICASQVDTQDDMQNSVHNTGKPEVDGSDDERIPAFSALSMRATNAMTLAAALILTRHYVVMRAAAEALEVFKSEQYEKFAENAGQGRRKHSRRNKVTEAPRPAQWEPPQSETVRTLEAALINQPGDFVLCDVADAFNFISEIFPQEAVQLNGQEDRPINTLPSGYNLLDSVWVPLQLIFQKILKKHMSRTGSTKKGQKNGGVALEGAKSEPSQSLNALELNSRPQSQIATEVGTNEKWFGFQFQFQETVACSMKSTQTSHGILTSKQSSESLSKTATSPEVTSTHEEIDYAWMSHIAEPNMFAMLDLGPAFCEFSVRARTWVCDQNKSTQVKERGSESLLQEFVSKEHELAFEMLRNQLIKPRVATLYARSNAMMPVAVRTLDRGLNLACAHREIDITPEQIEEEFAIPHEATHPDSLGCIAQGAIDTWRFFNKLLVRLTIAPATCCQSKGRFSKNIVSRELILGTLCREVLHNYARHLREMMSDVMLGSGSTDSMNRVNDCDRKKSTAWSHHRNLHTQDDHGIRPRDVLGKILKSHAPMLNQHVWCQRTPVHEDEAIADIYLAEVFANNSEGSYSMPAFYLEARALEADLLDATPDMPLPPEGFKLLSLTGDLDIVALIASTAMWMHKMTSALDLSAMAYGKPSAKVPSSISIESTHLGCDKKNPITSALQTIGELADTALHCVRTEVRLNCYAQIHLMRGRRYSWDSASYMQRKAMESPAPEAFVVSLAHYFCSLEEQVISILPKHSANFVVFGLPQLLTQLLLEGIRHAKWNQVCSLGVKQIISNCRALANTWACCRGTHNSNNLKLSMNDANHFQIAERIIELFGLPPKWSRRLLESYPEGDSDLSLQLKLKSRTDCFATESMPADLEASGVLHNRGIISILKSVNRNNLIWQDKKQHK